MQINSMICAVIRFLNDESVLLPSFFGYSKKSHFNFSHISRSIFLSEYNLACEIACGYPLPLRLFVFPIVPIHSPPRRD